MLTLELPILHKDFSLQDLSLSPAAFKGDERNWYDWLFLTPPANKAFLPVLIYSACIPHYVWSGPVTPEQADNAFAQRILTWVFTACGFRKMGPCVSEKAKRELSIYFLSVLYALGLYKTHTTLTRCEKFSEEDQFEKKGWYLVALSCLLTGLNIILILHC